MESTFAPCTEEFIKERGKQIVRTGKDIPLVGGACRKHTSIFMSQVQKCPRMTRRNDQDLWSINDLEVFFEQQRRENRILVVAHRIGNILRSGQSIR